jgi:hypothetical protein
MTVIDLDLDIFVRKINSVMRRNRTVYDLLELFAVVFIFLSLSVFFSFDSIFKYIPFTEPYVGLSPSLPFFDIRYEVIFSFFIVCFLSIAFVELVSKSKNRAYTKRYKTAPKREKATDTVERYYPNLKDRLNTAYDNKENNTIIAADLKKSVTADVDSVSSSGLTDLRRLTYSSATILVSILFLAALLFTGYTSPLTPDDLFDRNPNGTLNRPPLTPDEEGNLSSSTPTDVPPISSEPGVEIDVTLPPGTGVGPGDMLENSTESIFQPSDYYPPESLSSNHYYELLPEGYEDIIKDYFRKLAEQG